jgi:hypothetical protein
MARLRLPVVLVPFVLGLLGCSSHATAPYTPITNNPFGAKVQLAVGTANIFGDSPVPGVAKSGFNIVVTSRQPAGYQAPGDTMPLVDTPSLSGNMRLPARAGTGDRFGATVESGPAPHDAGSSTMSATAQLTPGTPITPSLWSTFGVSGGASGWGIEPFNYTTSGSNGFGQPASWVPWTEPLFDPLQTPSSSQPTDPNAFVPWGGPPAFDPDHNEKGARDGMGEPPGVLGVELGLDVFEGVVARAGQYQLDEVVATNAGRGTLHAGATLKRTATLPNISAPSSAALDQKGGATLRFTVPAGVSEAYLQVVDLGPQFEPSSSGGSTQPPACNTASVSVPVYYTFFTRGSGTKTLTLGDGMGPGAPGAPVPSLCTAAQNLALSSSSSFSVVSGDIFTVQAIGFDYPAFEAAYPQSLGNPAPNLAGSSGQSDITISAAQSCAQSGSTATCTYSGSAAAVRR